MATSTIRSSRFGRNSCSGGSSVRMTTGKPSIAMNRPAKSLRCMGRSLRQGLAAGLLVEGQNHGLHVLDAIKRVAFVAAIAYNEVTEAAMAQLTVRNVPEEVVQS